MPHVGWIRETLPNVGTRVAVPLHVRDLVRDDVPWCDWAGSPTHLAYVAEALDRAARGEVDYLAACPPSNLPLGIGGIDYTARSGAGRLWQLVVHPALRSCGIGTVLITFAEERIRRRGLYWATLGVEDDNLRARALYERLGYLACGRERESWTVEAPDGPRTRHETVCTVMRKYLCSKS